MQQFLKVKITGNNQTDQKHLEAGSEIADQLGLHNDQVISFCVGQSCIQLNVKRKKIIAQQFNLNPNLLKMVGILEEREYGIMRKANQIHIGPVIGIMADNSGDSQRPFRDQSFFISQLIKQGREIGAICFAFSANDINFTAGKIQGLSYNNKTWKPNNYPFPDVIYARYKGHSFRKNDIRNKLLKAGCKFINPALLGKWKSYKILSENAALQAYLPDTRMIKSFKDVEEMLKKYRVVYMKPVAGSQGENIIRVSQARNSNLYKYQYQQNKRSIKGTAHSINELQLNLKKVMGRQSYIVQQQIKLLRIQGGLVDMRVMVQKNESGHWAVTGKVCRIGKSGSITSNISSGGSACEVNELLALRFTDPQHVARISAEIDYLALQAALGIEKHYTPIGELGIDIGLDQDARLWFIEANLKPARKVFSLIGASATRLLSVQRPLLYARYLAGYQESADGK